MKTPMDLISRRLPASLVPLAIMAVLVIFAAQVSSSPVPTSPPRTPAPDAQAPPSPAARLESLLAKAAEYCRKLENSAFDFVCREEISESTDAAFNPSPSGPLVDPGWKSSRPDPNWTSRLRAPAAGGGAKKIERKLVYDYQCVRAGRVIREMRTQLMENGKRKVVPNATLETSVVVFGTALLAPVGLFGERFQPDYDFTIAGEEKVGKTRAVVIDAKPKPGAPPTRNLYGKAWVDPASGNILKIEWSESRVGRFDIFEKRGELYGRTPRLVISSEFRAEKNGIRFPSRLSIEEAYLSQAGRAAVRSRTEVVYKDFEFFTVEFEIH